jgi:hypothetical protein
VILWAVKAACATCVPSSSKQTLADSHCSTALQSIRSMDRRVAAVAVCTALSIRVAVRRRPVLVYAALRILLVRFLMFV